MSDTKYYIAILPVSFATIFFNYKLIILKKYVKKKVSTVEFECFFVLVNWRFFDQLNFQSKFKIVEPLIERRPNGKISHRFWSLNYRCEKKKISNY